ncbi:MAG: hypothetical protein Q4C12_03710 [Clostridia bacterium]|nr:hypothetical protein [Clostridia bacterium]
MTWDEYYEKFYDWANSTQISRISKLTSFGSADEICEVAIELCNESAATRLIKKAVAAGVTFSADQVIELTDALNEDGMNSVIASCECTFTREQLDDLYGFASNDVFEAAASRSGINYYEDDENEHDPEEPDDDFFVEPQPKMGFFSKLAVAFGIASVFDQRHKKHNGRCDGDCAHCPPHYGYRYGRWYYGHHHQHGCEFGGNKGI